MPADLVRLGLDDALAAVGVAPNSREGQDARALELLRRVGVAVDHVERRTTDALKRQPTLDREHTEANEADLKDADRLAGVLEAAHRAAVHMVKAMRDQVAQLAHAAPKPAPARTPPAPKAPEPAK